MRTEDTSEFRPTSSPELGSFKDRLRYAMRGRTARSVCRSIGIGDTTVSTYLSGKTRPGYKILTALAEELGVNIEWLTSGKGPIENKSRDNSLTYESQDTHETHLVDVNLLTAVIKKIERGLEEAGVRGDPYIRARLIAEGYNVAFKEQSDKKYDTNN